MNCEVCKQYRNEFFIFHNGKAFCSDKCYSCYAEKKCIVCGKPIKHVKGFGYFCSKICKFNNAI